LREERISRRVKLYGDAMDVSAAEALGRGLKSAERDGKCKDRRESTEKHEGRRIAL
jgi:hypothetical protein